VWSPTISCGRATSAPVTRVSLREAFRTVAAVQRRIASELELGVR
jgi:CBS domain-containing protein